MTLLGHGHGHKSAEQQQEVREARRLLKEKIRDDWAYPPLPEWQSQSSGGWRWKAPQSDEDQSVAGFRFRTPAVATEFAATSWREREYSSEDEADNGSPASASSAGSKAGSRFRFEGPDSVGTQISQRRLGRRRQRQRDLEVEMSWNPGLAHWMRQRDAWAGAGTAEHARTTQQNNGSERADAASGYSTPRTSSSHSENASSLSPTTDRSSAATTPDPTPASHAPVPTTSTPSASTPQSEILIPVAAPILPNHPIRRRITPAMYTEIYTKIIVQGRTPSVPINLLTLIAALVEGWKADGEWPPKPAAPEPSLARKKGAKDEGAIKHGVKAVGKVLRLTHTSHGHGDGD